MLDFITAHEPVIRLSAFAGMLGLMLALQSAFPRKALVGSALARWRTNGLIAIIDTLAVRLLGPLAAVVVAGWAAVNGVGVLNIIDLPAPLTIVLAIAALDLAIYAQHVATHKVALLWRFHQVHHADRDIDATTGVRFHPVEIVASMLYKVIVVSVLGPPVVAVILFEVLLNGSAVFNHANVKLPHWLDQALRLVIVTPDTHRVHHSVYRDETDSNYGFFLSVWDRLFGTYRAQPRDGHAAMTIGLPDYQDDRPQTLRWSMSVPFSARKKNTDQDAKLEINRRQPSIQG